MTHICVSSLTIIVSDNGLSPGRRQAIIWTNAGILLIGPSGTNFSEILIVIHTFSFKKMHLKMLSAKWRPFCLGLNVVRWEDRWKITRHTRTGHGESDDMTDYGKLIRLELIPIDNKTMCRECQETDNWDRQRRHHWLTTLIWEIQNQPLV